MFLRFLLFLPLAFNPFIISDSGIDQANEQAVSKNFDAALKAYEEAKERLPESAEIHFNTGLALVGKGEYEKGVAEFNKAADFINSWKKKKRLKNAAKLEPQTKLQQKEIQTINHEDELDLINLYAIGTTYCLWALAKEKEGTDGVTAAVSHWQQAVSYLEKAVQSNPDYEDAVNNLEIALLHAYPPCSKLDDKYEPNGNLMDAKFITLDPNTLEFKEDLMLCPADDDYFKIPVNTGEYFIIEAKPLDEKKNTDLRFKLLEEDGKTPVDGFIEGSSKPWKILNNKNVIIRIYHENAFEGQTEDNQVKYALSIKIIPPCPRGDDGYEENDTLDTAREIQDGDFPLRMCDNDDDWFKYTLQAGMEKEVSLVWGQEGKRLFLEVMSPETVLNPSIFSDKTGDQGMKVHLPSVENDVTYLIHVGGGENFYQLKVSNPEDQQNQQDEQKQDEQKQKQEQENQEEQKQEDQPPPEEPKQEQPIETMLDNLESNDENLEAEKALLDSPYKEYMPDKDW